MKLSKFIFATATALTINLLMSFSAIKKDKIILIDIGHGGTDTGAVFQEMTEHQINAAIAQKIKTLGDEQNVDIRLLGAINEFMSLEDRVNKINTINPDLMISIHVGASKNKDARLLNAFYSEDYTDQEQVNSLSNDLLNNLSGMTDLKLGKVKTAGFKVIKSNARPSILLEIGNLNNVEDRDLITSKSGQEKIAKSILAVVSK